MRNYAKGLLAEVYVLAQLIEEEPIWIPGGLLYRTVQFYSVISILREVGVDIGTNVALESAISGLLLASSVILYPLLEPYVESRLKRFGISAVIAVSVLWDFYKLVITY